MKSLKETKLAQILGGKGAYITLAAVVLAAGGAGAAAYGKAVKTAEQGYDFSISDNSAAEAEKKAERHFKVRLRRFFTFGQQKRQSFAKDSAERNAR